jgi:hypothetical protein
VSTTGNARPRRIWLGAVGTAAVLVATGALVAFGQAGPTSPIAPDTIDGVKRLVVALAEEASPALPAPDASTSVGIAVTVVVPAPEDLRAADATDAADEPGTAVAPIP